MLSFNVKSFRASSKELPLARSWFRIPAEASASVAARLVNFIRTSAADPAHEATVHELAAFESVFPSPAWPPAQFLASVFMAKKSELWDLVQNIEAIPFCALHRWALLIEPTSVPPEDADLRQWIVNHVAPPLDDAPLLDNLVVGLHRAGSHAPPATRVATPTGTADIVHSPTEPIGLPATPATALATSLAAQSVFIEASASRMVPRRSVAPIGLATPAKRSYSDLHLLSSADLEKLVRACDRPYVDRSSANFLLDNESSGDELDAAAPPPPAAPSIAPLVAAPSVPGWWQRTIPPPPGVLPPQPPAQAAIMDLSGEPISSLGGYGYDAPRPGDPFVSREESYRLTDRRSKVVAFSSLVRGGHEGNLLRLLSRSYDLQHPFLLNQLKGGVDGIFHHLPVFAKSCIPCLLNFQFGKDFEADPSVNGSVHPRHFFRYGLERPFRDVTEFALSLDNAGQICDQICLTQPPSPAPRLEFMVALLAPIRRRLHQQEGDGFALYPHEFIVDLVTTHLAKVSRVLADPRPEAELLSRNALFSLLAAELLIPADVSALFSKYQLQQAVDARLDHRHPGVAALPSGRKGEARTASHPPRQPTPPARPPSQHQRRRSPSPPSRSERYRSSSSDRPPVAPPSAGSSAPPRSICLTHLCYHLKVDSIKCTKAECRFSHVVTGRSKAELVEACAFLTKNPLIRAAAITAINNGSM